jgi:hypothetical protein
MADADCNRQYSACLHQEGRYVSRKRLLNRLLGPRASSLDNPQHLSVVCPGLEVVETCGGFLSVIWSSIGAADVK